MENFTQRYPQSFNDDTLHLYTLMWLTHDFNHSTQQYAHTDTSSSTGNFSSGGGFSGGGGGGSR